MAVIFGLIPVGIIVFIVFKFFISKKLPSNRYTPYDQIVEGSLKDKEDDMK